MRWAFAMNSKDLPEGKLRGVVIDSTPILLARVRGEVFAMYDKCAHMECRLSKGGLEGHTVTCPCHKWRYDLRTGEFLDAREIKLRTFECRIEEGEIQMEMDG